ncbi:DUF5994 family protein [Mycobacterium sp. NPDC050041]|uniref:DUF5994 family protein n=1 Tax=Mycobacterium sp. NPDC050041 TaxID=3364293 RepID=UPI003C2E6FF6
MTQRDSMASTASRHPSPPDYTPRLRLKPKAAPTGYVDGAWWPHSDDLQAELPDLLAVLSVRLGRIERVMYHLGEWAVAPAKATVGDRVVRLDGYVSQPVDTLAVRGLNRTQCLLLVIPPATDAEQAHRAMMAAAAPDSRLPIAQLLSMGGQ